MLKRLNYLQEINSGIHYIPQYCLVNSILNSNYLYIFQVFFIIHRI